MINCVGHVQIGADDFLQWLSSDPARVFEPVLTPKRTHASWSCGCPLATYAREKLNYPHAAWALNKLYPESGREEYLEAPAWTMDFVKFVDSYPSRKPTSKLISFLERLTVTAR